MHMEEQDDGINAVISSTCAGTILPVSAPHSRGRHDDIVAAGKFCLAHYAEAYWIHSKQIVAKIVNDVRYNEADHHHQRQSTLNNAIIQPRKPTFCKAINAPVHSKGRISCCNAKCGIARVEAKALYLLCLYLLCRNFFPSKNH
ncbi:hypothetical protein PoB_006993800 [Plakobranchus ocellatus]|uniref:Uncharacterized protein n=1 Tax=Plakobranchus ocellatus TaxID=259542 RepID=A0AAV4DHA9_9GAST|nr:hypothetical protein PoB_006993800 [Plakobranchus ocellatus]